MSGELVWFEHLNEFHEESLENSLEYYYLKILDGIVEEITGIANGINTKLRNYKRRGVSNNDLILRKLSFFQQLFIYNKL